MEPQSVQLVGAPCGQHGPYTFYKAFKYKTGKKQKILSLGEFFFIKTSKESPVCIGELQLIWQEKNNKLLLGSVRLYYLPEHTPDGRLVHHGEDEVLAESDKFVLKLEDLVDWIIWDVDWPIGHQAFTEDEVSTEESEYLAELTSRFTGSTAGLHMKDVEREKQLIGDNHSRCTQVIILSFPQYCRYRAVLKRLYGVENKWLRTAVISAIGGFTVTKPSARVLFCRETFDHPELQFHDYRQDHLAPNLKGRPRKKRMKFKKDTESDSGNESDPNSSGNQSSQENKPKQDARRKLLKPQEAAKPEEKSFLKNLYKFMSDRNTPIERIPSLGFKQIDLFFFWSYSKKLGGYNKITQKRLWKHIYDQMGGNPANTSAATCTRRHYERLLLPYERHMRGEADTPAEPQKPKKKVGKDTAKTNDPLLKPEPSGEAQGPVKSKDGLIISPQQSGSKPQGREPIKMENPCITSSDRVVPPAPGLPTEGMPNRIILQGPMGHASLPPHVLTAKNSVGHQPETNGALLRKKGPSIMSPIMSRKVLPARPAHPGGHMTGQTKMTNAQPVTAPSVTSHAHYARTSAEIMNNRPSVIHLAHRGLPCQPSPAHSGTKHVAVPYPQGHKRSYPYPENVASVSQYYTTPPEAHKKSPIMPRSHHSSAFTMYHDAAKRPRIGPVIHDVKSQETKPASVNSHRVEGMFMYPKQESDGAPQDLSMNRTHPEQSSGSSRREEASHQEQPINLVKSSRASPAQHSGGVRYPPAAHQKVLPHHPGRLGAASLTPPSACRDTPPPPAHSKMHSPLSGVRQHSVVPMTSPRPAHQKPPDCSPVAHSPSISPGVRPATSSHSRQLRLQPTATRVSQQPRTDQPARATPSGGSPGLLTDPSHIVHPAFPRSCFQNSSFSPQNLPPFRQTSPAYAGRLQAQVHKATESPVMVSYSDVLRGNCSRSMQYPMPRGVLFPTMYSSPSGKPHTS